MNWINDALDLHGTAMRLRGERATLLAANIANADTPSFKARDLEFRSVLDSVAGDSSGMLDRTNERHLTQDETRSGGEAMYRIPVQQAIDGNTVEMEVEKSEYSQNVIRYQASAEFLDGSIRGLLLAIRGQ